MKSVPNVRREYPRFQLSQDNKVYGGAWLGYLTTPKILLLFAVCDDTKTHLWKHTQYGDKCGQQLYGRDIASTRKTLAKAHENRHKIAQVMSTKSTK